MFGALKFKSALKIAVPIAAAVIPLREKSFCTDSSSDLDHNWVSGYSPEGHFYYYNTESGQSSWTKPNIWLDNWDLRHHQHENKKEGSSKSVNHQVILIRHGQYDTVKEDKGKLTAHGREQALRTGERLQELVSSKAIYPIKYIYYSTMPRATETHELIQSKLSYLGENNHLPHIEPCSMIREAAVCRPNPTHATWKPTDEEFTKEGMRVEAAFTHHMHRANNEEETENYTTVLVCHGNVIRYFAMKALQVPVDAWLRTSVGHCSFTSIMIRPNGRISLTGLGDVGHLNAKDITY